MISLIYSKVQILKNSKKTKLSQTDRDALQVMELNDETKWEEIHTKFKKTCQKISS